MANILICDDAMFVRQTLKNIVTELGFNVVGEAGDGKECIQKYHELKPDFIMMDINMPDMDGIEATTTITAEDNNVKIIIVSAMGQQDKVMSAIAAGAKDFIVKPFVKDTIKKCLDKYI